MALLVGAGLVRASTSGIGVFIGLGLGLIGVSGLVLSWRVRVVVDRPHVTIVNPFSKHEFDASGSGTVFDLRAGLLFASDNTRASVRAWGADSKLFESGVEPAVNPRKNNEMTELLAQIDGFGGEIRPQEGGHR